MHAGSKDGGGERETYWATQVVDAGSWNWRFESTLAQVSGISMGLKPRACSVGRGGFSLGVSGLPLLSRKSAIIEYRSASPRFSALMRVDTEDHFRGYGVPFASSMKHFHFGFCSVEFSCWLRSGLM